MYLLLHNLQDENLFMDDNIILKQMFFRLRQLNQNISVGINKLPVMYAVNTHTHSKANTGKFIFQQTLATSTSVAPLRVTTKLSRV